MIIELKENVCANSPRSHHVSREIFQRCIGAAEKCKKILFFVEKTIELRVESFLVKVYFRTCQQQKSMRVDRQTRINFNLSTKTTSKASLALISLFSDCFVVFNLHRFISIAG